MVLPLLSLRYVLGSNEFITTLTSPPNLEMSNQHSKGAGVASVPKDPTLPNPPGGGEVACTVLGHRYGPNMHRGANGCKLISKFTQVYTGLHLR